jgi:hypothetical protein
MQLKISPYILTKRQKQNARDSSLTQEGALLRVQEGSNWGVADICPKPELGDQSLAEESARRGDCLPERINYLLPEFSEISAEQYRQKTLKIKCGRNVAALSAWLNTAFAFEARLRLDFNSGLQGEEFDSFIGALTPEILAKIEYVEDPTAFSEHWRRWNQSLPLAADFEKHSGTDGFIQIFKPSRERINEQARYTLTSAMEHPVGLAHALRIAQQRARGVSGFLTLNYYEETAFDRYFQQHENHMGFSPAALHGAGIGMESALSQLVWSAI